jgi:hypothetical protein
MLNLVRAIIAAALIIGAVVVAPTNLAIAYILAFGAAGSVIN